MVWGQNQNSYGSGMGGMGMGGLNMQGMASGRGILGESPGTGGMGMGMGIQGLGGGMGGSDNLDTMIQQRRLQQQLSLRESQLALASNLLQKQNQLMMDVGLPGGGGAGSMGSMLPSPPMSRPMIPSLLDMPAQPRKRTGPMNRDAEFKRRRRDSSPSDQRGRNYDFDRRRDRDQYSPNRRRGDPPSRRDRPSRFSRRDSGEARSTSRKRSEEYDPANPTDDGEENFRSHMSSSRHRDRMAEVLDVHEKKSSQIQARMKAQEHLKRIERTGGRFCKLCDQELSIPFMRHKQTTLHKKREMQVHKGCGWCGVKNFVNFSEVLKHREKESHKENAAKYGKKSPVAAKREPRRSDSKTNRTGKDLVTIDSVGFDKDDKKSRSKSSKNTSKTKEQDPMPELKYQADTAIGQNYVIAVSGFFCKLCHKFYNTEAAAKVTHCQSQAHFVMFKKAKIAAKVKAQKSQPKSTSTPISDKAKPDGENGDADADNTMAEMKNEEEKMEEGDKPKEGEGQEAEELGEKTDGEKKTAEGDETKEEAMEVGETDDQAQGEKDADDAVKDKEPTSVEDTNEKGEDVANGDTENKKEQKDEEAGADAKVEEAGADAKVEENEELTEEEQEKKLLEKDGNESEDGGVVAEDIIFGGEEEADGEETTVDLVAEDSKGDKADPKGDKADEDEPEQAEAEAEADEAAETESVEGTPPAGRGKGRARATRRAKKGKK